MIQIIDLRSMALGLGKRLLFGRWWCLRYHVCRVEKPRVLTTISHPFLHKASIKQIV